MMSDTMMSDMSDIAAGAIVTCPRATAAQLSVVVRSAPGGSTAALRELTSAGVPIPPAASAVRVTSYSCGRRRYTNLTP